MKKENKKEKLKAKIIYADDATAPIIEIAFSYVPKRLKNKIEMICVRRTITTKNTKLWDILD